MTSAAIISVRSLLHGVGHFFLSWRDSPLVDHGLLIHEVCFSRSHTTTHHSP